LKTSLQILVNNSGSLV